MPSYKVLPLAELELDEYAYYIAQDNLDAALRLYDAAEKTYFMLAEQPNMGAKYDSGNPILSDVRFFTIKDFKKYLVFYHQTKEGIEIMRVIRTSKDIRDIKNIL